MPTRVANCHEYTAAVATMKIVASDVAPAATPAICTGKASATVAPRRNTPAPANADAGVAPSWLTARSTTATAPATTVATTSGSLGAMDAAAGAGQTTTQNPSQRNTPQRRTASIPEPPRHAIPQTRDPTRRPRVGLVSPDIPAHDCARIDQYPRRHRDRRLRRHHTQPDPGPASGGTDPRARRSLRTGSATRTSASTRSGPRSSSGCRATSSAARSEHRPSSTDRSPVGASSRRPLPRRVPTARASVLLRS